MPYPGPGANLEVATFPGCLPIWRRLLGEIRAPYRGKPVLRTESERLLSSMGASISPRTSLINFVPTPHNTTSKFYSKSVLKWHARRCVKGCRLLGGVSGGVLGDSTPIISHSSSPSSTLPAEQCRPRPLSGS